MKPVRVASLNDLPLHDACTVVNLRDYVAGLQPVDDGEHILLNADGDDLSGLNAFTGQ